MVALQIALEHDSFESFVRLVELLAGTLENFSSRQIVANVSLNCSMGSVERKE